MEKYWDESWDMFLVLGHQYVFQDNLNTVVLEVSKGLFEMLGVYTNACAQTHTCAHLWHWP